MGYLGFVVMNVRTSRDDGDNVFGIFVIALKGRKCAFI